MATELLSENKKNSTLRNKKTLVVRDRILSYFFLSLSSRIGLQEFDGLPHFYVPGHKVTEDVGV